jgi:hypothetical protein
MVSSKKQTFPEITPCKFHNDEKDENCCTCDGVVMVVDGVKYSCKDCQGYTEPDPIVEPVNDQVQQPIDIEVDEEEELPPADSFQVQGVTTTIKAESGLSVEIKDKDGYTKWFKFNYSEERKVPENCDLEVEKQALWNAVNKTVDEQMDEALNS